MKRICLLCICAMLCTSCSFSGKENRNAPLHTRSEKPSEADIARSVSHTLEQIAASCPSGTVYYVPVQSDSEPLMFLQQTMLLYTGEAVDVDGNQANYRYDSPLVSVTLMYNGKKSKLEEVANMDIRFKDPQKRTSVVFVKDKDFE